MNRMWLKIWIWTKVVVFGLLFIYALVFCSTNHARPVKVWVWINRDPESTVLTVVVGSFFAGVIATILVRTTMVTLRQFKEIKQRNRAERLQRDLDDMNQKAAMLQSKAPGDSAGQT